MALPDSDHLGHHQQRPAFPQRAPAQDPISLRDEGNRLRLFCRSERPTSKTSSGWRRLNQGGLRFTMITNEFLVGWHSVHGVAHCLPYSFKETINAVDIDDIDDGVIAARS